MFTGILQFWNGQFGFVHERGISEGKPTLISRFVHITNIKRGLPIVGSDATYDLAPARKKDLPDQCVNVIFDSPTQTLAKETDRGSN